jgi:YfiH family protein
LTVDEIRRPGDFPLWEVPGWRERFGIAAGITGRATAAGAPVDLGLSGTSPAHEVMARWRELRAALPGFGSQVVGLQVHGTEIREHVTGLGWVIHDGVDGHLTGCPGTLLLVTVADCVPVYLLAPKQRQIAILHAGWRGTAAGILEAGIARLLERSGSSAGDLVMHCGVAISGPCYEVGREVMDGVGKPALGPGPWHLDLRAALVERGRALGVGEVTASGHCTARDAAWFHSHRRSRGADGRMVAWLGVAP